MKIVLDTNVLVSGLLNPFGTCGEVVRMLMSGKIMLCADARILLEYEEVLLRPKFDIDPHNVHAVMEYIQHTSEIHAAAPLDTALPDTDDAPFLEVALASGAACLVTGNPKHFPARCRNGVHVLSPRQFIDQCKSTE